MGGNLIGSQELSKVIWNAINQSIHFEERDLNKNWIRCFSTLDSGLDLSPKLSSQLKMKLY